VQDCAIDSVDVCNKDERKTYYPQHWYRRDDGTDRNETFDSINGPSGEGVVVEMVNPVNESNSDRGWVNDTVEVFRTCPAYSPESGGEDVVLIGRNFQDTALLTCRWTACLGDGKDGNRPRKCRDSDGFEFGDTSKVNVDLPAKFISPTRVSCPNPGYKFTALTNTSACTVKPSRKALKSVSYTDPVDNERRDGLAVRCPNDEVAFGTCPHLPNPDSETK
jgi:hypothetical protein